MQSYEASQSRCPLLELVRGLYSSEAIAELLNEFTLLSTQGYTIQLLSLESGGGGLRDQLIALRVKRRKTKRAGQVPTWRDSLTNSSRICEHCGSTKTTENNRSSAEIPDYDTTVITWQARLKQIEEREVALLAALQNLKANFSLLQTRQSGTATASRSMISVAKAPAASRPKLLQRMGSLVGLSSGSALEHQVSSTTYADQLFHAPGSVSPDPIAGTQPDRAKPLVDNMKTVGPLPTVTSENSPRIDTSSVTAFSPSKHGGLITNIEDDVNRAQLEPRQRTLLRARSQISMTRAATSSNGHATNGLPGQLLRRLSPSIAGHRKSPTYYADTLFRHRIQDPRSPSTEGLQSLSPSTKRLEAASTGAVPPVTTMSSSNATPTRLLGNSTWDFAPTMAELSTDAPTEQDRESGLDLDVDVNDGNEQSVHVGLEHSDSMSSQSIYAAERNVSVPLRRGKTQIYRRHSTMTGAVHPTGDPNDEGVDQPPTKAFRRSMTTRMMLGRNASARSSFAASFNPIHGAPTEIQTTQGDAMIDHEPETPSVRRNDGAVPDPPVAAHSVSCHARNGSDDANLPCDGDAQVTSNHGFHTPEHTSFNDLEPPLVDSVTSSAQLGVQFNLVYGTVENRVPRYGTIYYVLESMWMTLRNWQYALIVPLSPYSKFSQVRYAFVLFATICYVLWFPMELAFPEQHELTSVDAVVGVVLASDVLLTLHTGYVTPTGTIVISHWYIFWQYVKTRLVIDVAVAVPLVMHVDRRDISDIGGKWVAFALDLVTMERLAYITRFVRMIWLAHANQAGGKNNFWAWLLYSRFSHLFRIAGIVTMLVTIAHYIACIWTVLLREEGIVDEINPSWHDQYSASFYSALLLLQGEGVSTDSAGQNLFASLSVLVGSIVLAVVFGHVAILVSNFNANTTSYQHKMEEVFAMTSKLQLPLPLRERIHEYYEHLWHEYECLDGDIVQFSKELSHTLGLEVVLFKYMELVMHIPFWKDSTPDFQKQLMLRLDVRVYLPNDFIMRQGEVDDEFYMVNRGYCELSRELNKFERVTTTTMASAQTGSGNNTARSNGGLTSRRRHAHSEGGIRQSAYELDEAQRLYYSKNGGRGPKGIELVVSRGQAFGDLALLMNYPRAANVRAITHVEMCVLSRANFQAVLARYAEDRHRVVVDMLTSFMQSYEGALSRCPMLELVRSVYSPDAIAEACAKAGGHLPYPPPVLTARQAAERIYMAINVEIQDPTLKFGVGVNVRDQLIELRDQRRRKCEAANVHDNSSAPHTAFNDTSSDNKYYYHGSNKVKDTFLPKIEEPVKDNQDRRAARLQKVEEREIDILKALQELQASLNVLQVQKSAQPVTLSPNRQVFTPVDNKLAAPISRPHLLKRMGSSIGLSSGSSLIDAKSQKHEIKESPPRYADQLFGSVDVLTQSKDYQSSRKQRPHLQPIVSVKEPIKVPSETENNISTAGTSVLAVELTPSESIFSADKAKPSDQPPASSPPPGEAESAENPRIRFQRQRSRSLYESTEDDQTLPTTAAPPSTSAAREALRRNRLQRNHSQSLRSLADALTAPVAPRNSVGSLPATQIRILQRMSTFVADASGQVSSKQSPTHYADELFRRKSKGAKAGDDSDETA
ncbi:unnamed protein product [Phytophthora fragariaefolia]|uniref:Unnamed protein product n=1 Tax=Phytophthora fragariaefolia TaxID=1490495 RepID=A0A9W6TZN5_9STRA|nr:unnamed protein product [Phytophthora fragariaefolia]